MKEIEVKIPDTGAQSQNKRTESEKFKYRFIECEFFIINKN